MAIRRLEPLLITSRAVTIDFKDVLIANGYKTLWMGYFLLDNSKWNVVVFHIEISATVTVLCILA